MRNELIVIHVVLSLLVIAASLPLIYEKVPPNRWYGFGTPESESSDSLWYRANKLGGQYFLIAALVQLIVALLLPRVFPSAVNLVMGTPVLSIVPPAIAICCWLRKVRRY
jgi:uncharacterized membrane protein